MVLHFKYFLLKLRNFAYVFGDLVLQALNLLLELLNFGGVQVIQLDFLLLVLLQ